MLRSAFGSRYGRDRNMCGKEKSGTASPRVHTDRLVVIIHGY